MAIGLKTQAITWPLPFMLQLISLRLNVLFLYFSYVQYKKKYEFKSYKFFLKKLYQKILMFCKSLNYLETFSLNITKLL